MTVALRRAGQLALKERLCGLALAVFLVSVLLLQGRAVSADEIPLPPMEDSAQAEDMENLELQEEAPAEVAQAAEEQPAGEQPAVQPADQPAEAPVVAPPQRLPNQPGIVDQRLPKSFGDDLK